MSPPETNAISALFGERAGSDIAGRGAVVGALRDVIERLPTAGTMTRTPATVNDPSRAPSQEVDRWRLCISNDDPR